MAELKSLGRYTIERVLGKGAMGVVYEAVDPRLNRRVAIKTILRSSLDEVTAKNFAARFVQEAQAVARLNHPNIVQVHDFGEEGDIAYIVMEFIRGRELKAFFDTGERFDLKEAVRIMTELCEALDFAHQAGIVHRDVKPGNVMLDSQSRTKLTDFGVARMQDVARTHHTQEGTMVGTPAYMSPEQITGSKVDRRTDVFSAGIILYQFLTGELPFSGGAWTIAKKIMQDAPPLPSSVNTSVTPLFDAVVNKALAKNPDQRYQSAKDFSIALKRALEGKPFTDDSDSTVFSPAAAQPRSTPAAAPRAAAPAQGAAAGTQSGSQEVELEFWRAIKDGNDAEDFELYVEQFPTGIYAKLARRKIAKLRGVAPEETGLRAREQEEQEKREQEEAARREAEVRAKRAVEDKARREIQTRQETLLAKREAELKKREATAPEKSAPVVPMIVAGIVVAAIAGGAWFALRPDTAGDTKRMAALVAQLEEAKKREADLKQSKEREAELLREAERARQVEVELTRQREAEAKKSGDVARQKELAEQARLRGAEALKQAELNKQREAELARLQAEQKKQADFVKQREAELARLQADAARQREAEQARQAAEKAAAEKSAAAARAAAEKAAAEKSAAAARAAAETAAADKARAEQARVTSALVRFPQAGDSFTYQLTDHDSRDNPKRTYVATVTTSSPGLILEDIATPGAPANLQGRHTKDHYVINLGVSVFSPYLTAFRTLEPGSTLGSITNFDSSSCPMGWLCTVNARVVGRERVQVPAGSFDAVKVELQQSWFGGAQRDPSAGRRVLTIWYSPVTKRALKFSNRETLTSGYGPTGNFDLELTSYQLK